MTETTQKPGPTGFLVHFEKVIGRMLATDYFPSVRAGLSPIPAEEQAWQMAEKFASETRGQCVNVYVVRCDDFTPVAGFRERAIENLYGTNQS